jgi:hypothetical protein
LHLSSQQHQQQPPYQSLENTATSATTTATTKELAGFIVTNTPKEFLWAVKKSGGKFLYRGEEPSNSTAATSLLLVRVIPDQRKHGKSKSNSNDRNDDTGDDDPRFFLVRTCNPAPDLLLPETYGYDLLALQYFEELEIFLSSSSAVPSVAASARTARTARTTTTTTSIPKTNTIEMPIAKPSNGHIATSDALEAGKWGKIVSVWPLLPSTTTENNNNKNNKNRAIFSYVWPRNRSVFYESGNKNISDNSNSNSRNDSTNTKTIRNNSLMVINEKLEDALTAKGGREVLFAFAPSSTALAATSSAAFLAIPTELDVVLRDELERIDYGLCDD